MKCPLMGFKFLSVKELGEIGNPLPVQFRIYEIDL
jgi:hypothetical protein